MNKLVCQKCQNIISNDFNQTLSFCTNCGASIQSLPIETPTVLGNAPTLVSPTRPNNISPPKSYTAHIFLSFLGILFLSVMGVLGYWVWSGMSNSAKHTYLRNCPLEGEPPPVTAEDYFRRAEKHIEIFTGNRSTSLDDCAIAALSETIRLDPKNVKAWRLRGYGYRQKKQYDLALADFDKAIQIEPNNPNNFYFRSLTYRDKGLLDKAIEDISKAIDLTPKEDRQHQNLVDKLTDFYREKGDYENLIKHYTEQIRLKPDYWGNYGQRAYAYMNKGDFENAVKDYTEMIRIEPNEANHYFLRSQAYRKLGKKDLADSDTKKGNELFATKEGNKKTASTSNSSQTTPNPSQIIMGGVLNGKAINLVQPEYSPAARAVRASGAVNVQVTVDESGNVVSAQAVSGHVLLKSVAESAARASKFSPTILNGKSVKVSGIIVYNFTP